jgi:hypothetical protein
MVHVEEPRVVIAVDLQEAPVVEPIDNSKTLPHAVPVLEPDLPEVSGELVVYERADQPVATPQITVEIADDENTAVVIHEQLRQDSEPVLLERRRQNDSDAPTVVTTPSLAMLGELAPEDDGPGVPEEVLELPPKRTPAPGARRDRHTQLGIGAVPAVTRARAGLSVRDDDLTRIDAPTAPQGDEPGSSDEILAAPPSPASADDTSPHVAPPASRPPASGPPPSGKVKLDNVRARSPSHEDYEDDRTQPGSATDVMSSIDEDDLDDGWGPPGTTIPPPLLGAIPGALDEHSGIIPMPNIDSAPLMVAPPVAPEVSRSDLSAQGLARALEHATAGMLELIRHLERANDRDEVVALMIAHLALTHRRAGFFAVRAGELSLFAVAPRPATLPFATVRLDRPSTLQDVVGTRLPYRGPMHDDASRSFLAAVLGASPPEILLVPVTLRERVVGVLFGEQRVRHTFDDQLALAARAAGQALERILKARRG